MPGYLLDTNSVIYFFNGDEIIKKTIEYRKNLKMKTPDAIIAATAKVRELTLVTADKSFARKLTEINLISPI